MASGKMHIDEVDIDASLVSRLIATQFPQWANLPIVPFKSDGTDNVIYRLGDDMAVRLPRVLKTTSPQMEKERLWLPKLAPMLPLAIPVPLGQGVPVDGYPGLWSVYRWIEGKNAVAENVTDPCDAAALLGQFVASLQQIDPANGPIAGAHNFFRGVPLSECDEEVRSALKSLQGMIDIPAATTAWEKSLRTLVWKGRPCWIHGDLHPGNLLVHNGRLNAVIDFGGLGVGDPACDLMVAWTYLSAETREVFRVALKVDDATWARGRGWALYLGLVALPYYQVSNPVLAGIARRSIAEVLADPHSGKVAVSGA